MRKLTPKFLLSAMLVAAFSFFAAHSVIAQTTPAPEKAIYTYVEQMPEYAGGQSALMQYIGANVTYRKNQPEGMVFVSFVVEKDGTVNDVQVAKSIDIALDTECIRVIKETSGKWTPGKQNGKNVAVRFVMPIRFEQPKEQESTYSESMPEYKAGTAALLKFLYKNIKRPKGSTKNGIVKLSFTVQEDGSLSDFQVAESLEPVLDAEAIRVTQLTSGNWKPGMQNGKPVKVRFTLPLIFKQSF